MAQADDMLGIFHQNLIDAGCDEATTETCMELVRKGKTADTLPLLKRYKTELLGIVRMGQKKIDCLDFLIYQVQKQHS